jgi:3-hydroxyisobutyrate dehydrogenase-like beta-hydroxyacid dehydrogenase
VSDVEYSAAPVEALALARAAGFSPDHAQLVIWGSCASCAAG